MPNHLHLIVEIISAFPGRDEACLVSTNKKDHYSRISPKPKSLPIIIGSLKSAITKQGRLVNPQFQWQPRYHDHIIRSGKEFYAISKYIEDNLKNWDKDEYNKP